MVVIFGVCGNHCLPQTLTQSSLGYLHHTLHLFHLCQNKCRNSCLTCPTVYFEAKYSHSPGLSVSTNHNKHMLCDQTARWCCDLCRSSSTTTMVTQLVTLNMNLIDSMGVKRSPGHKHATAQTGSHYKNAQTNLIKNHDCSICEVGFSVFL